MVISTTNCKKHGHLEIALNYDASTVLNVDAKWLIHWIEDSVSRGAKFLPEQSLQLGWIYLEIRQRTDGTLGFFEPDFKSLPIKFVDSVSLTLSHLRVQKSVAESLGLENEINFSSLRHSAIVCNQFTAGDFILSREKPTGSDSGWFFGCLDNNHDHNSAENLRRASLYEAALRHNERIIPYLALPHGIIATVNDKAPTFLRNGEILRTLPGSYLDRLK